MASVRRLKKDINFITDELVIECFMYNYLFPEKNEQQLTEVITESINMKSQIIDQINQVKPTKENTAKKQFGAIRKELFEKVENLVERLENLEKK